MLKQADRVRLELEKKLDESKERLKEQGGAIQGQVSCLNRPKFEHLKRHCTAEIKKLCFFNLHVISTNTVAALQENIAQPLSFEWSNCRIKANHLLQYYKLRHKKF